MGSLNTETLAEANQLLSASIHAIDAYIAGTVRCMRDDEQQMADLTCHALLLVNMVAKRSGQTVEELSSVPIAGMPALIRDLRR